MTTSEIPIRAKPTKSGLSIRKGPVFIALGVIAALISYAVAFGFTAKPRKPESNVKKEVLPSDDVRRLPGTYAEIIKAPLPKPSVTERPSSKEKSELEKEAERAQAEALRRRTDARISDVSFTTLKSDIDRNLSSGGVPISQDGGKGETQSARDDANRQDDKRSFLHTTKGDAPVLPERVMEAASPYLISAGTIIPGVLLSGINSDLPGQILGQVSQNVFDSKNGHFLLIPQGTKVLGEYDSRIVYGQERVLVVWTRLIFPDTSSLTVEGMPGIDMSGYAGLTDQVNNHYGKLLSGVLLTSLLGASAQMAEGPSYRTQDPTYGQLAVQGVAQGASQVGQEVTRRNLNIQPTLEIAPGQRFSVFVTKDLIISPRTDGR